MSPDLKQHDSLSRLEKQLHRADAITRELMSSVLAQTRSGARASSEKASRVHRLIDAEAWTDVALALIDLELPQWKLRHLVNEDGTWSCALSKCWHLPQWLDDAVEASHPVLELAILCAFVAAQQGRLIASEACRPSVPQVRPGPDCALCCDNFA